MCGFRAEVNVLQHRQLATSQSEGVANLDRNGIAERWQPALGAGGAQQADFLFEQHLRDAPRNELHDPLRRVLSSASTRLTSSPIMHIMSSWQSGILSSPSPTGVVGMSQAPRDAEETLM
jgi:hypothetical protein